MINDLKKIIKISKIYRDEFIKIQFIIIIYSSFQTLNLYLLKPYIDSIVNNDKNSNINFFIFQIENLSFTELTFLFLFTFIFTSILSVISLRQVIRFSQKIGQKLKAIVFKKYISLKFQDYIGNSSSELHTLISIEIQRATSQIIQPLILIIYRIIPVLFILIFLFILDPKITLSFLLILVPLTLSLVLLFRKKLASSDKIINQTHHKISKNVLESFQNIKQIKVFKLENFFFKYFKEDTLKLIDVIPIARVVELIIKSSVEIIIISLIAILFLFKGNIDYLNHNISIIITFFLGAYRILPGFQTIYSSYISIKGNIESLKFLDNINHKDLYNFEKENNHKELKNEFEDFDKFQFDSIDIKNLTYSFGRTKIFNKKNFLFKKNKVYSIKGHSGSGKTTLMDLMSGLLVAEKADYFIDKKKIEANKYCNILNHVSCCTQKTAIFNASILENITFEKNINYVDKNKLNLAIDISGLKKIIDTLPLKLDEIIAENGENFSGGQIQRIGLARSLYKSFSILILDESTSALDEESENKIFQKIIENFKKDKIIFIISHSDNPDKFSDQVIYL